MTNSAEVDEGWLQAIKEDLQRGSRVQRWTGPVWRCHSRRYSPDSHGGSLRASGRFHRATDKFTAVDSWPALYTGCSSTIALGEVVRNTIPADRERLFDSVMSGLRVDLHRVFIAHDAAHGVVNSLLGLDFARECESSDYRNTQEFARMARDVAEAILVPSCTRLPEGSLIIFPDRLDPGSSIRVIDSVDLALVKQPRDGA